VQESSSTGLRASVAAGATSRRLAIAQWVGVVFLYWIALYLYVPTLPTYVQSKGANLALVGVVLSMYGLWQMIIRLPLGIAADSLGRRKPFIVGGLILASLGAWLMGTSADAQGILVGRAVTGLAAGTWVPLVVVFSSLFPADEAVRASALLTAIGTVGRIFGTSATGWLNGVGGYPLAFFLAAGVAGLAVLLTLTASEQRHPSHPPSMSRIGHLITRRDVLLPALLSAVCQFANWATVFSFLPIAAKQIGASDVTLSMLVTSNLLVNILGNLTATGLVRRFGARPLALASFVLLSIGIGGAALAPSVLVLAAFQLCIGFAMGISYPVLMGMSIRYVVDEERTTAMGLHQSVYALGMFAGPWLGGIMAEAMGIRPMFGVTAVVCLIIGAIGTRLLVERARE
jgi:MFS family permease